MRSFAGVGDRFLHEMVTTEGTGFRGTIMPASDQEGSPFEFSAPRLILRTRAEAEIHPGVIIVTRSAGPRYLVGDHYAVEADYRSWRLFLVEKTYAWSRKGSTTDTLTGLPKSDALTPLGTIQACVEFDRRMFTDPGLRLKTERVTVITNQPILVGDLLDGQLVTRVTRDLGLYIVEHQ